MQSTTISRIQASEPVAIFACDVGKDSIYLYTELGTEKMELNFKNRTRRIQEELQRLKDHATKAGFKKILVVAEPTGIYHRVLLRIAIRLAMDKALVSGEAVAKMRVIETNDSGKTDIKDPKVIFTLARLGKTLKHRILDEPCCLLREWHRLYESEEIAAVECRCAIHSILRLIFPDLSLKKDFIFGPSGEALVLHFGANPHKILDGSRDGFFKAMKRIAPRIRTVSIKRIFMEAQSSRANQTGQRQAEILELRLKHLYQDWKRHHQRKKEAREAMEALYHEARLSDPRLPEPKKGLITAFHLARIIAKTGPIGDFDSWRMLLRFAGLNLRERRSGNYRGRTKISKKGNSKLRKVLGQVVLPLVKRNGVYGDYYHRKKTEERMPGTKAMVAVARHFLKMLYGCYQSGGTFDIHRVFVCESQYQQAA